MLILRRSSSPDSDAGTWHREEAGPTLLPLSCGSQVIGHWVKSSIQIILAPLLALQKDDAFQLSAVKMTEICLLESVGITLV